MAERRTTFFAKYHAEGHPLDPHRVAPNGRWTGVSKVYVYPKDCNDRAGKFLSDNFLGDDERDSTVVRLVHGYYQPPKMPFASQHAWVDLGTGVVFDGVLQGFYDAAGYAKVYRTEEVVRYTVDEMVALMLAHRHWGPWHPAIRDHKPPPPSARAKPDAYVVLAGKPRRALAVTDPALDGTRMLSLLEDVGPVGQDYFLAGDALGGRPVGKHRGLPLYELSETVGPPAEGAVERPHRAAKMARPARRRGKS